MKKIWVFIIVLAFILLLIAIFIFIRYELQQKKLAKCLEPTRRPVHTGLKNIDDCYISCCEKNNEERQQCFDFCYSID